MIVPIIVGVILILVGLTFASQGAGMMGGSSLMDNNVTFVYVGTAVLILGLILLVFGAVSRPKVRAAGPAPSGSLN
jgi:hypothetical protein